MAELARPIRRLSQQQQLKRTHSSSAWGAQRVRTGHFLPSLESPSPTEPSPLEGLQIITGPKTSHEVYAPARAHSWNLALVSHERPSPILKMLRATSCLAQLQSRPQWISAPRSCHDSTNSLMSRHPTIRPMLVFLAWPPLSGSRQLQGVPEALEGPIQALKNSDRPAAQHHMLMLESFMLPRCILRSIFPFVFRGSFSICTMLCGLS